jgi:hypothetical protein
MACEVMDEDVYQCLYEMLTKYDVDCSCSYPAQFDKGYLDNGYVDHCCSDDAIDFVNRMLSHEHALIKYLFSDESFVVTANDNCSEDDVEWIKEMTDVSYPHETYYKGN